MALSAPIQKARDEGLSLIDPLQSAVMELTFSPLDIDVMSNEKLEDNYLVLDAMLGRIQAARKRWSARIGKIIDPLWEALQSGRGLKNEVDKPLEVLEVQVKGVMKSLKIEERRRITAAAEEEDRLRNEAAEQEARELAAKTPQMKARLAAKRQELETKADTQSEAQIPVMAGASTTRTVKKWRVIDQAAFIKGLAAGKIPAMAITVNTVGINQIFKSVGGHDAVAAYPGVEVYDDIDIVGR